MGHFSAGVKVGHLVAGTKCCMGRKWDILSSICRAKNAGGTFCRWDKMSPNRYLSVPSVLSFPSLPSVLSVPSILSVPSVLSLPSVLSVTLSVCHGRLAKNPSFKDYMTLLLRHWYEIMALYNEKSILTEISAFRQDRRVLQNSKIIITWPAV